MTLQEDRAREVVRVDLSEAVTASIREMILRGELAPGERLVETALANAFRTSRGPVRDALAHLERTGLVTINPRRGTFVTKLTPADVDEVYTLRLALETLAVERAASRATAEDLRNMEAALGELTDALAAGDDRGVGEADMRFHRTIVAAAHHRRLAAAWEVFADQTLLLMQELSHARPEVQARTGAHGKILAALKKRDASKAVRIMSEHLQAARDGMLERFAQP